MNTKNLLEHKNAELILEKGWKLFQRKGYRGASMDELCRICRISKPTLYYYFKDKENLFIQILEYKLHDFHTAAEGTGTISQRLQNVALAILNSFSNEYSSLLHDREHIKNAKNLQKIRLAFHQELFEPLTGIMQAGIDSGEIKKEIPETLTLIFLGIINNFIGKSKVEKADATELAFQLTQFFLEGAKFR